MDNIHKKVWSEKSENTKLPILAETAGLPGQRGDSTADQVVPDLPMLPVLNALTGCSAGIKSNEADMKRLTELSVTLLLILFWVSTAVAQSVNLAWDPSSDPSVAGYQVYYQAGNSQPPFLGTEAAEGMSPIDVGPSTSLGLALPDDGRVYYFTVTAYNGTGAESSFSNIVANQPMPMLLEPGQNSSGVGQVVTFSWSHEVTDPNTTYTLAYGPEAEVTAAGFLGGPIKTDTSWWLIIFGLLALLPLFLSRALRFSWLPVIVAGFFGSCLVTACGGGGGSESSATVIIPGVQTQVVSELYNQYYVATDLVPGQTYYWKVLAIDGQGVEVESEVFSFSTANVP